MRTALVASLLTFMTAVAADEPCGALPYDFRSGFEHSESYAVTLPPANTPLAVAIDARFVGMVTDEESIDLDGTYQGPPNTGVSTILRAAQFGASQWHLQELPLAMGINAITVRARDLDGNEVSALVSIERVAADADITALDADVDSGHAPRMARFRFRVPANRTLVNLRLDADGNGQFERDLGSSSAIVSQSYANPGFFLASAQFTLDEGDPQTPPEIITRTTPVLIQNLERTRKTLCFAWGMMKTRLIANNIAGAQNTLIPRLRAPFDALWTGLGVELPAVATGLGTVADGKIGSDFAELIMVRPSTANPGEFDGFRVQFDQDREGIWRIGGM